MMSRSPSRLQRFVGSADAALLVVIAAIKVIAPTTSRLCTEVPSLAAD